MYTGRVQAALKGDAMPVKCGSEVKQTATADDTTIQRAVFLAQTQARALASGACGREKCAQGNCVYNETKLVGKTTFDPGTKKWTSSQTSSGKCACVEEEHKWPCKMEIEQTVVNYGTDPLQIGYKTQEMARLNGQHACDEGKCEQGTKPNKCEYVESKIEGEVKMDPATGKYVATETSFGKCKCEKQWR